MSSPEWALQTAMTAALAADAGVRAQLGDPARVYDDPPDDVVFPFVTFGSVETRPADGDAAPLHEHVLNMHAWSRYGGRREAKEVAGALRDALHDADLDLGADGHRLVNLRVTFVDVLRMNDGRTTRAVVRLRAVTEPS